MDNHIMDKSKDRFMDKPGISGAAAIIAALSFALPLQVTAAQLAGKSFEPGAARLIVKFRASTGKSEPVADATERVAAMAVQTGVWMNVERELSGGAHLVTVDRAMAPAELAAMARNWSRQPDIEYAEPDALIYPRLTPNDPLFARQYYLKGSAVEPGGINTPGAWNVTTGSEASVVAVIDSGILFNHVDIGGRTVPGYDFIGPDPGGSFGAQVPPAPGSLGSSSRPLPSLANKKPPPGSGPMKS